MSAEHVEQFGEWADHIDPANVKAIEHEPTLAKTELLLTVQKSKVERVARFAETLRKQALSGKAVTDDQKELMTQLVRDVEDSIEFEPSKEGVP